MKGIWSRIEDDGENEGGEFVKVKEVGRAREGPKVGGGCEDGAGAGSE